MKCKCDILPAVIEMLYMKVALFGKQLQRVRCKGLYVLQTYIIFTLGSLIQNMT